MTIHRVALAAHIAYLDPMTGQGKLVRPRPAKDVSDPLGPGTVHEADWNRMVGELDQLGWTLAEGDDGAELCDGMTADGREVIGLYGLSPVISLPTLDQLVQAEQHLRAAMDAPVTEL